jgi:hypothetical protein
MTAANDNRFTAADVRRAVKAVESGGKSVAAVDFPREGGFRLLLGEPVQLDVAARMGVNEWDDVLAS